MEHRDKTSVRSISLPNYVWSAIDAIVAASGWKKASISGLVRVAVVGDREIRDQIIKMEREV